MILKYNTLKVERVPKIFENLNSFETMLKILKTMQNILKKTYFLDFCCFHYFWIFLKIYQNMDKKLGSNNNKTLFFSANSEGFIQP